jgi:3-oxoacyl-[acyl-carrier protein] reductase
LHTTKFATIEHDGAMSQPTEVLAGKTALVIGGGGGGIGRAITRAFGAAGAAVAVADVDPARAEEAVEEIVAAGAHGVGLSGDVRQLEDVEGFVERTVQLLGGIDVLVTVVGGQVAFVPAVRLHEMADADWDLAYEMNLRYVVRAVRAVLPRFLAQGSGTVVSIGSVTGVMAAPKQAGYGAAKAGLASLARTVAAEYAADGIRMNVIAAGAVATQVAAAAQDPEGVREIPMGRYGLPGDVAQAAVFLASDQSSYLTGQSIVVDGGVTVRGPFPD